MDASLILEDLCKNNKVGIEGVTASKLGASRAIVTNENGVFVVVGGRSIDLISKTVRLVLSKAGMSSGEGKNDSDDWREFVRDKQNVVTCKSRRTEYVAATGKD